MLTTVQWQEIQFDLKNILLSFERHYRVYLDIDDVMQDIWMVAHEKYDPNRGELLPFCILIGKHIIIDARRKRERHEQVELTKAHKPRKPTEELALPQLLKEETWALIEPMMQGQSSKAQVLWVMYTHVVDYGSVPSMAEIGRYVGLTRERVRQILNEIVEEVNQAEFASCLTKQEERIRVAN